MTVKDLFNSGKIDGEQITILGKTLAVVSIDHIDGNVYNVTTQFAGEEKVYKCSAEHAVITKAMKPKPATGPKPAIGPKSAAKQSKLDVDDMLADLEDK